MSVQAKVTVTLLIDCSSTWNDNTTIDQVRRQAIDDAHAVLRRMQDACRSRMTVQGKPKVSIISFDPDAK